MMEKNILDEIERLKHDYIDLKAEINELNNAINKSQISNSRKRGVYTSSGAACEAMLKFIYQKDTNHQKPVNKLMLDELLIKVNDLLPPQVMINFRTIQAWRNYGTHDKDDMRNADSNSFIMVDMALSNIVNWFFTSYLKIDTPSENKNLINITEIDKVPQKKKINTKKKSADIYLSKEETHIPIENSKQIAPKNKSSVSKPQKKVTKGSTESTESGAVLTIGSQVWTSKNLDVTTYRNGDVIPQVQDANAWANLLTGAWCYYDNDASNGPKYGKLYNWYAVNDPRGLAPKGFHIPSDVEWEILTDYLGGEEAAGTKMKSSFGWDENGNGTNSSGFAGFPSGYRNHDGTFYDIGRDGYWWSATEFDSYYAWYRSPSCYNGDVYRDNGSKQCAFSVRCLEGSTESTESAAVLTIGSQVWTSKNLDVTTYRNGDVIPQVQDANAWANLLTGAWCYYDNDASNGPKYGKLYNWYAVNDPRGLAPKGFHIPSDVEWEILTDYLGGEEAAGTKMKSSFGWDENGNGTNSSGFAGFPGGYRDDFGTFDYVGSYGYWWSATEFGSYGAWFRYMIYDSNVLSDSDDERSAFSVRCLGD